MKSSDRETIQSSPGARAGDGVVRAPFVQIYLRICESMGLPRAEHLEGAGVSEEDLDPPDGWVSQSIMERLCRYRLTREQGGISGARLALPMADPSNTGLLGFLCMSCPSIQGLYAALVEFGGLTSNIFSMSLIHEPGVVLWSVEMLYTDELLIRDNVEWFLAACATQVHRLDPTALLEVRFRHSPSLVYGRPDWLYEKAFPCPVRFGQDRSALVIEAQSLTRKSPKGDALTFDALLRQARLFLQEPEPERNILERTRRRIRLLLAEGHVSRERLCEHLGISSRHLHRLLKRNGSSYQQLLDDVRAEQAERRLAEANPDMEQLAMELGFSGVKSFSRWFVARFGATPSVYRRREL